MRDSTSFHSVIPPFNMYVRPLGEDNETVWAVVHQQIEDTQPISFLSLTLSLSVFIFFFFLLSNWNQSGKAIYSQSRKDGYWIEDDVVVMKVTLI